MQNHDTYAYLFGNNLYINLTNRCNNDCEFCVRRGSDGVGGNNLWIVQEPSFEEVKRQMLQFQRFDEVVFCGYGEPLIRLEVLKQVAAFVKRYDIPTRIDTNGLANRFHGRDITPELEGLIDTVSISLNASNPEEYDRICHSEYGTEAFGEMIDFAIKVKKHVPKVIFSVVETIGKEEIDRCKKISDSLGIPLRVREYIEPER